MAAAVAAWLEARHQALLQELQPGACLTLELDVVDLAGSQQHREVVEALLGDPGERGPGELLGLVEVLARVSGLGRPPARPPARPNTAAAAHAAAVAAAHSQGASPPPTH